MGATATFDEIFLAYRQAKNALTSERLFSGKIALATFEMDLNRNITRIASKYNSGSWFDDIEIGNIFPIPKSSTSKREEEHVLSVGTGRTPTSVGFRFYLQPSIDFAIMEVLYLRRFGRALEDAALSEFCVANRLNRSSDEDISPYARYVFRNWRTAFKSYRDDPIDKARSLLGDGSGAIVVSTDISNFFDSVSDNFLVNGPFFDRITDSLSKLLYDLDTAEYTIATQSLVRSYKRYRDLRDGFIDPAYGNRSGERLSGIPIGSLTSQLVANLALSSLDRHISSQDNVVLYRRYVDDIVIVKRTSSFTSKHPANLSDVLGALFPNYETEGEQSSFVDPETKHKYTIRKEKTLIHNLQGESAIAFLDEVQNAFSAVASERRAFFGDVDTLEDKLQTIAIFPDSALNSATVPRLRNADRFSLRNFATHTLANVLMFAALTLDRIDAKSFVRRHIQSTLATLDSDCRTEDIDFVLSLYRIASILHERPLKLRLVKWIRHIISDSKDLRWHESALLAEKTRYIFASYIDRRIADIEASVSSYNDHKSSFRDESCLFYLCGLRFLPPEEDAARFNAIEPPKRKPTPPNLSDSGLLHRLQHIERFLSACKETSDSSWDILTAQDAFLSLHPPSFADVARRFLLLQRESDASRFDAYETISQIVDAFRETSFQSRHNELIVEISDNVAQVKTARQSDRSVRVILGNLPLSEDHFISAAKGSPRLSLKRMQSIDRCLRDARRATSEARTNGVRSVLILPELSIPRILSRSLTQYAIANRMSIVFGTDYGVIAPNNVVNEALGVFPLDDYNASAVLTWQKGFPADREGVTLEALGKSFPEKRARRMTFESMFGRLGVLICSEILEASALADLRGKIELLLVPAWNDDVASFDHMSHSIASLLLHVFVGVANNAEASDSRIVAPIAEPKFERELCRIVHRGESRVIWADLPLQELEVFHNSARVAEKRTSRNRRYRPLPPGWHNK